MKLLILLLAASVLSFAAGTKLTGPQVFVCPPSSTPTLIIQTATGLSCLPIDGNTIKINAVGQLAATLPASTNPVFVDVGTLTGTVDGTNTVFNLSGTTSSFVAASLAIYRNGVRLAVTTDYTLSGTTVTFVAGAQPQSGDVILATWRQ